MTDVDVDPNDNITEHPFAQYVRILGKGKKGSRSLTLEEAKDAMGKILDGEVEEVQLGAFLMLLRVKEETPEELAGFVQAVKERIHAPSDIQVDLDWSSYAGKRRHLPWFVLSIMCMANKGIKTFIHGASGHTEGRLYTESILKDLGLPVCTSWEAVKKSLVDHQFAYLKLSVISAGLDRMINLRPILGLRSPVHSLSRLINPLDAPSVVQGIFHPPYLQLHQLAGALLNYDHFAVIKGEGGEIERNPDNEMKVLASHSGKCEDETWPSLFDKRHIKGQDLSAQFLKSVWKGDASDEYGEAAVVSTMALALKTMGRANTQEDALSMAQSYWETRNRHFIG